MKNWKNAEPNSRLPKIALGLSLIPMILGLVGYLFLLIDSIVPLTSLDLDHLFILWYVVPFYFMLQLCCASAGMTLSIYAITQKIRMKASITALILSAVSIALAGTVLGFRLIFNV